jgi:hypothetical protein
MTLEHIGLSGVIRPDLLTKAYKRHQGIDWTIQEQNIVILRDSNALSRVLPTRTKHVHCVLPPDARFAWGSAGAVE